MLLNLLKLFLWEIGWFPFCSRVRSFGTCFNLLGIPRVTQRMCHVDGGISPMKSMDSSWEWKTIIHACSYLLPLKPIRRAFRAFRFTPPWSMTDKRMYRSLNYFTWLCMCGPSCDLDPTVVRRDTWAPYSPFATDGNNKPSHHMSPEGPP